MVKKVNKIIPKIILAYFTCLPTVVTILINPGHSQILDKQIPDTKASNEWINRQTCTQEIFFSEPCKPIKDQRTGLTYPHVDSFNGSSNRYFHELILRMDKRLDDEATSGVKSGGIFQVRDKGAVVSEPLFSKAKSFTVKNLTGGSSGSGVLARKEVDGYTILTAAHVIKNYILSEISILTADGEVIQAAEVQDYSPYDLATIRIITNSKLNTAMFKYFLCNDYIDVHNPIKPSGFEEKCTRPSEQKPRFSNNYIFVMGYPLESQVPVAAPSLLTMITYVPSRRSNGYSLEYFPAYIQETADYLNQKFNVKMTKQMNTTVGMSGGPIVLSGGEVIGIHGQSDTLIVKGMSVRRGPRYGLSLGVINKLLSNDIKSKTSESKSIDWEMEGSYLLSGGQYNTTLTSFSRAIKLALSEGELQLVDSIQKSEFLIEKVADDERFNMGRTVLNITKRQLASLRNRNLDGLATVFSLPGLLNLRSVTYKLLGGKPNSIRDIELCTKLIPRRPAARYGTYTQEEAKEFCEQYL